MQTDKSDVSELVPNDAFKIKYHPVNAQEEWRVSFIRDIIDGKNDQVNITNIEEDDLDAMLNALCTS